MHVEPSGDEFQRRSVVEDVTDLSGPRLYGEMTKQGTRKPRPMGPRMPPDPFTALMSGARPGPVGFFDYRAGQIQQSARTAGGSGFSQKLPTGHSADWVLAIHIPLCRPPGAVPNHAIVTPAVSPRTSIGVSYLGFSQGQEMLVQLRRSKRIGANRIYRISRPRWQSRGLAKFLVWASTAGKAPDTGYLATHRPTFQALRWGCIALSSATRPAWRFPSWVPIGWVERRS